MTFLRQLRWRIIGTHMIVVIAGVTVLTIVIEIAILRTIPNDIRAQLTHLSATTDPAVIAATADILVILFRQAVLYALTLAALGALVVGILSSLFLAREILRPLQQLAHSSQRIASGHYGERVPVPSSDELALVAIHFNQMAETLESIEGQRVALIGNVSHELRTPLTGLEGYLEGLIDGIFPTIPETFADMSHEVRRLRRLVDDLQDLSRVEAGQVSLKPETFNVIPVVRRVVGQLQSQAVAQELTLNADWGDYEILVQADLDRTAQVLLNLTGNALHYTPEGGRITIQVAKEDGYARISVVDTGLGIPAEALPYLFERFYRVDASRSRRSGGSGIGLTIARHLVWAMGGELTAASPGPGQGSTFTFTLPLSAPCPSENLVLPLS